MRRCVTSSQARLPALLDRPGDGCVDRLNLQGRLYQAARYFKTPGLMAAAEKSRYGAIRSVSVSV